MTEYFCTLFDRRYLVRGLCLFRSLARFNRDIRLYVLCFDEQTFDILSALADERLLPVRLADFESPGLLKVKTERSAVEYFWTCTPHWIAYVLQTYGMERVTYLDADLYFFSSPTPLFREFEEKAASILLTPHRYSPPFAFRVNVNGLFCVQFMVFRSDDRGQKALGWWQEKCLEWCSAVAENGRFGDQKYLDDWPERFPGVLVSSHVGGGVAPWNVQQYRLEQRGPEITVNGDPLVYYHFHNYRRFGGAGFDLGNYPLSRRVIRLVYRPYERALQETESSLAAIVSDGLPRDERPQRNLSALAAGFKRLVKGTYNVRRNL